MAGKKKMSSRSADMADDPAPDPTPDGVPALGEIGLEQFTPYLLNRISMRWNANLQPILRKKGLTTAHMRTLAVLSVSDGRTVNELSALTVIEQSTLSRALDVMEGKGLIERRVRESDARFIEVFITETGRQRFGEFWPSMFSNYQHMFNGIGEAEAARFNATMRKILTNIRKRPF